MSSGRNWIIFRAALFLAGLAQVGYVIYRYTLFNPPDLATLYGKIFPLSLLLAGAAMMLALRPYLFEDVQGHAGSAARGALTSLGLLWMATGVMCAGMLAAGIAAAPLGGTFDMLHMVTDHVFLPFAVGALLWAPASVARWLGGQANKPFPTGSPALGPTSV